MSTTHVIGIRLTLVFECDDPEEARAAAHAFGSLLCEGFDPLTATVCVVNDAQPSVKRMVYIGHETGYRLIPDPASRVTAAQ